MKLTKLMLLAPAALPAVLANLDIDGFLLSQEFLGAIATLISSILVGILNVLLFGALETT
jgi:hypothetical protein